MGNLKKTGFVTLGVCFITVIVLAFITHLVKETSNPWLLFAIKHHTWIMVVLIAVSVIFGYFWSNFLYKQIETEKKTSKSILEVVLKFLGREERMILNFLVENKGKTSQAEISRLHGMNKVKAFRSLQKMQEKQILDIEPHGKVRYVKLNHEILEILSQQPE